MSIMVERLKMRESNIEWVRVATLIITFENNNQNMLSIIPHYKFEICQNRCKTLLITNKKNKHKLVRLFCNVNKNQHRAFFRD